MTNKITPVDHYEKSFAALKGNTFGIIDNDGSIDDKIIRLLNLLPVAFQVVDEARETIARLRDENDSLRKRC